MNTCVTPSSVSKIIELRALLGERFPAAQKTHQSVLPTGVPRLDAMLGGGLPRGTLTEVVRPLAGCGAGTLIHVLLEETARCRGRVALVDGRDVFDPDDFDAATLAAVLWVRCRDATAATKATDWLLRDGNLPLVLLDLTLNSSAELQRVPGSTWHRLAHAAQARGVACLALTPCPLISSASARLELEHRFDVDALDERRGQLLPLLRCRWLRRREAVFGELVALAG